MDNSKLSSLNEHTSWMRSVRPRGTNGCEEYSEPSVSTIRSKVIQELCLWYTSCFSDCSPSFPLIHFRSLAQRKEGFMPVKNPLGWKKKHFLVHQSTLMRTLLPHSVFHLFRLLRMECCSFGLPKEIFARTKSLSLVEFLTYIFFAD